MKDLPIFFVSGLPRSGSTLLMNLLGQNPKHHVTPTNDLIELLVTIRNTWQDNISFKAQGLDIVKPRIIDSMRSMMWGFFSQEFLNNQIVFDKSRGWIAYVELLEEVLQKPVKVIVTVRDMKSIISSFEIKYRESMMTKPNPVGDAFFDVQSIDGRIDQLLNIKSVLGLSIQRLRDALERGVDDRLVIVPYKDLTTNTNQVLNQLHNHLGLESFNYNTEFVDQITNEDDSVHGMDLHTISNEIEYKKPDHNLILKEKNCNWIDKEFFDINSLANE